MADVVALTSQPPAPTPAAVKMSELLASQMTHESQNGTDRVTVAAGASPPPKTEPKSTERPAWLPEGFETPEAFAEAYKALKEPKADAAKTEQQKAPEVPKDQKDAEAALQKAGLSFDEFSKEFSEKGALSAESKAKLAKAGIPEPMVDAYIEGQRAAYMADVSKAVGGEEVLTATLKWAESLPQEEIDAANEVLKSGDAKQAKILLKGLHARRVAAEGIEPQLASGKASPGRGDARGYESTEEWMRDVRDPRYKRDSAFRDAVAKRIAASKF